MIRPESYNLMKEFNWRGDVAEMLIKHKFQAFRTKGYEYKPVECLNRIENNFLKANWKSIDLFKVNEFGHLEIIEAKSRGAHVRRKPDITKMTAEMCKKAINLGIPICVVYVIFSENWEFSFEVSKFNINNFRINDGGWYRKKNISL